VTRQIFKRNRPFVMATPAAAAVPRLRSRHRPGPLSESVALAPICQTRRPSAKTLRCGAELAGNRNGRSLAAPKDIDLTGLGQVLPEEVPRTILVGRRTDEIVRADRPARGRGCRGRLRAAALLRVRRPGQPRAISSCPSVASSGLTDARRIEVADRFITRPTRAAPPRQVPHQRCGLRAG